ncbi:hypothetical protein BDV96DRAFT_644242 [Lophiotrema nucula]|uniref:Cell wall protein PhiA n=1 Tax=Lophiotrema nucula TaxID=690887 RepID=A0A6A5ZFM4_9PLEO|nr:hypothetical protein BDV96DRAFT_644242 [Lophiotrema nucula]
MSVLTLAALLSSTTLAAPAGSKHNVYLVHCDPQDCPIGLCDPGDFTIAAAAYFANGPVTEGTTRVSTPTSLGRLSDGILKWEGTSRSVRLGTAGTLKSNIPTSARTAAKGDLAGDATLGTEEFVCFKDGSTKFAISNDGDRYTCTTDYWCGSVDAGSTTTPAGPRKR